MATPIPDNSARFEAAELETLLGGEVRAPLRDVLGVTTDSRRVGEGQLFVALRGEQHDGHTQVASAAKAGAAGVLVEEGVALEAECGVLVVDDTLSALGALGAAHAKRAPATRIAITGSVGKTGTKELVAAALAGAGRSVLATRGNLNNRIGVPMTLLTIEASHDVAVLEMGMSEPGEIAKLAAMVEPSIGVVTSVEAVHTAGVGGLDGVLREKGALLAALGPDATAIYCGDYPALAAFAPEGVRTITYGSSEGCDVALAEILVTAEGTRARVVTPRGEHELSLRLLGAPAALHAAAAVAVLESMQLDVSAGLAAIGEIAPSPQRLCPLEGPRGALIVDDTYNASPASTRAAIECGAQLASERGGRLLVVLGDMLELGRGEESQHAEVGRAAVEAGAFQIVAVGERMVHAGREALRAAMEGSQPRPKIAILRKVEDAAGAVLEHLAAHDVVVVKGSRGMQMERVVEALQAADESPNAQSPDAQSPDAQSPDAQSPDAGDEVAP